MNILFLTNNEISNQLILWLRNKAQEKVTVIETNISKEMVESYNPDFLISYNYKYIIKDDVLSLLKDIAINLHISFLPWNRGADPNLWSFLENTPKGVTIHYLAPGIDTGDILCQQALTFKPTETLKSSYAKLSKAIEKLFMENWAAIRAGQKKATPQKETGTYHVLKDNEPFRHLLTHGWDTPVSQLIGKAFDSKS